MPVIMKVTIELFHVFGVVIISVPVPPLETVTDCAAGLEAPAATEKVADADESSIAGADAGGCVHGAFRILLGDQDGVSVGRAAGRDGDEAAGGDDAV